VRPIANTGEVLDASFHVEPLNGNPTVVLESRFGQVRNPDYNPALDLLLTRLRAHGAVITDAIVDSTVSRALPFETRRLRIRDRSYPIDLTGESDLVALRIAIGAAQKSVAQKPGAVGGNPHKRIRLFLKGVEAQGLEVMLAGGAQPDRQVEEAKRTLEGVARPPRGGGQGRGLNAEQRRAVELRAVAVATLWLEEDGWDVEDVSLERRGYDLHATRGDEELHVEVKGTTGSGASVILTPNEVRHAGADPSRAVLSVVSGIELSETDGGRRGDGGVNRVFNRWRVSDGALEPVGYEWILPPDDAD
jgi:Domain of unknown function (DUF3883)